MASVPGQILEYLLRPYRLFREYEVGNLRPDLYAGIMLAVILLPQAIAFALVAELPPQMGLYTAIVASMVAALWGSSHHVHTGPTMPVSLLVFSSLLTIVKPGTPEFLIAAGMLAVMTGILQVVMGFARLGLLINFVSHSVVVGFSAGAAVLIIAKESRHLLGLSISDTGFLAILRAIPSSLPHANLPTLLIGAGVLALILALRKWNARFPGELLAMILAALVVYGLGLQQEGVNVLGKLPSHLPPLKRLPLLDLELLRELATGALAIAAIGLVATTSIARTLASETGQRLDSNQEFVGQGLANIAAGLFSGYPAAGSFSRSALTLDAGARTSMSAVFSGLFVAGAMLLLGPLVAYLPRAALSGVLVVIASRIIQTEQIRRILKGTRGDAVIMLVTFFSTLLLEIEFAVLAGIFLSLGIYIIRTSTPRVVPVLPDDNFRHFIHRPDKPEGPQLGILDILGDLYFGAANHVEQSIYDHMAAHPRQRFLLLRMYSVNQCDFSGIHMLERVVREYRDRGGDVFMMRLPEPVLRYMKSTGFYRRLGADNFLADDSAIGYLFHRVLDPAICIYECDVRAFKECQNLPKYEYPGEIPFHTEIPAESIPTIAPGVLWQQLRSGAQARVVDVREPREFRHGHIPGALSLPLSLFVTDQADLSGESALVLVCRSGRRSTRAAAYLKKHGYDQVQVVAGGMLAWENAGLLTAVENQ